MRAWPHRRFLWIFLLAAGAVTLIRCHSGGSGGAASICGIADCLGGNHYAVTLSVNSGGITNFRRTGGCSATTITMGSKATYDGCTLKPTMEGNLVVEFKLCQIGSELIDLRFPVAAIRY